MSPAPTIRDVFRTADFASRKRGDKARLAACSLVVAVCSAVRAAASLVLALSAYLAFYWPLFVGLSCVPYIKVYEKPEGPNAGQRLRGNFPKVEEK